MVNIILCGGSGTRLFPLSRAHFPKQFIEIFPKKDSKDPRKESLFLKTYCRNAKVCDSTYIVSNTEQYFLAKDQLESISPLQTLQYLLEPIGKNTAPAILLAALTLPEDTILLITPSDHLILEEEKYFSCVKEAQKLAEEGYLVTFGITPTAPETGFGYIHAPLNDVLGFYEKPNLQQAQEYLKSKEYLWNAGIFCFKVKTLLQEAKAHANAMLQACQKAIASAHSLDTVLRIPLNAMQEIPEDSLDYAILEKSKNIKVVKSTFIWSDVGSFDALAKEFAQDSNQNILMANVESLESHNNFVFCENKNKILALVGVENLIVIETADALLIAKRGESQKIKHIVQALQGGFKEICAQHTTTHRPWGSYTILENAQGYKIKRIVVKQGKRLSLQKHLHRNEHWIVVSGTANVEIDGITSIVRPNESIYIKMGQAHRLSNAGKIPVVLIEAQVGEYTQEDDIIRIEDDFGREEW